MRLVLDTNVVASAMLWGGNPKLLLQAGRENRAKLFTSVALLTELEDVLARPIGGSARGTGGCGATTARAAHRPGPG